MEIDNKLCSCATKMECFVCHEPRRWERGEAVPSIDAAKKIADAFEVSMDYLVGEGVNVSFDKKNLKRLQDIEKLDDATKDKLYFVIDNIVQNFKAKKAYAS